MSRFGDARQPQRPVFGRKGEDERSQAHAKLDQEIEKIYGQDGRLSKAFEQDIASLKQDIAAQQRAVKADAPTYSLAGGGFNFTPNKPTHEVLLPDELRKIDAEEIAKHPGVRALNAKLRTEGLQATVGSTQVFSDGAYDNTRDESAYAPCLRVSEIEK